MHTMLLSHVFSLCATALRSSPLQTFTCTLIDFGNTNAALHTFYTCIQLILQFFLLEFHSSFFFCFLFSGASSVGCCIGGRWLLCADPARRRCSLRDIMGGAAFLDAPPLQPWFSLSTVTREGLPCRWELAAAHHSVVPRRTPALAFQLDWCTCAVRRRD